MFMTRCAAPSNVPARHGRGRRAAAARRDGAGVVGDGADRRATRSRRLGFVYIPMGMNPAPWTPAGEGRIAELSPSLASLTPFLDHLTRRHATSRCRNSAVAGGNHATAGSAFLSCARAKRTEGSDYELGDHGRSGRGAAARRRHADPVARARHRPDRAGRQLRQRLRLRLPEQPVVVVADHAAADRGRPAACCSSACSATAARPTRAAPSCARTPAFSTG